MSDMLADAAEWLTDQHKAHVARVVEYRRGATTFSVRATVGQTLSSKKAEAGNTRTEYTDRDFVFAATDLLLAGLSMPPQRNDRIIDTEGGATSIYEVRPINNEPAYRWCDGSRSAIRVHTKRIS
jgi:hypothetical protein